MRGDLDATVGYNVKKAQTALRASLEPELRVYGLTLPQYACLELLHERPGQSNAELARGAFVTRQAMHQLLTGLRSAGLVRVEGEGRDARFSCAPAGTRKLKAASAAAAAVEARMLEGFDAAAEARLLADLKKCVAALATPG